MGTSLFNVSDFGLPSIGGCPLNACLQILYHSPSFIACLTKTDHHGKCRHTENCVLCLVIKIWEKVKQNEYCGNLNSELCQLLGCTEESEVFQVLTSIVSEMHYAFLASDPSNDLMSPAFDVFGCIIETEEVCLCHTINTKSTTEELTIGIRVKVNEMENLQQGIDELFNSKVILCETCGSQKTIAKIIHQLADTFLICPIRPENEHFQMPSSVFLGASKQYDIIGSINNRTTAIVKSHTGSFVQLQDKRKRGVSWSKFQSDDTQNTCNVLMYQRMSEGPAKFREVKTPVPMKCSTPVGSVRSTTTAWNVTPIPAVTTATSGQKSLQPKRLDYGLPALTPNNSKQMSPGSSKCADSPRTPSQQKKDGK